VKWIGWRKKERKKGMEEQKNRNEQQRLRKIGIEGN
jgi:hypothetical protein